MPKPHSAFDGGKFPVILRRLVSSGRREKEDLALPTPPSSNQGWENAVCVGFESEKAVEQSEMLQTLNETLQNAASI